jgi:hypothetical protein
MKYFTPEQQKNLFDLLDTAEQEQKTTILRIMTINKHYNPDNTLKTSTDAAFELFNRINNEDLNAFRQNTIRSLNMSSPEFRQALNASLNEYVKQDQRKTALNIPNEKFDTNGTIFDLSDYYAKVLTKGDKYGNGAVWNETKPGLAFLLKQPALNYKDLHPAVKKNKAVINGITVEATPGTYYLDTFYKNKGIPQYGSFSFAPEYPTINENEYCQLCERSAWAVEKKINFDQENYFPIPNRSYIEYVLPKNTLFAGSIQEVLYNNHGISPETKTDTPRSEFIKNGYTLKTEAEFSRFFSDYLDSLCNNWNQISPEKYSEILDLFPPMNYKDGSFFVSQPIRGDIHSFYIHKKDTDTYYRSWQRLSYDRNAINKNLDSALADINSEPLKKYHELLMDTAEKNLPESSLTEKDQYIVKNLILPPLKKTGAVSFPVLNQEIAEYLKTTGFTKITDRAKDDHYSIFLFDHNRKEMEKLYAKNPIHDRFVSTFVFNTLTELNEGQRNSNAVLWTFSKIFKGDIPLLLSDFDRNKYQINSPKDVSDFLESRYNAHLIERPDAHKIEQFAASIGESPKTYAVKGNKPKTEKTHSVSRSR